MAKKVALINMKGGVGKSTLAVNLAWEIATDPWNKRVLVVDLDPQFNCTQYLLGANRTQRIISQDHPTVWNIFEQLTAVPGRATVPFKVSDAVVSVRRDSIDLIPSRLELSQSLRNPTGKEHLLKIAIEKVDADYDLIVVDCAPTDSILTTSAYRVCDHILIPVRPEYLSTIGLPLLEQSINEFAELYPDEQPEILGIVFNAVSDYSPEELTSKNEVREIARTNYWPIFDEEVTYSKSFPKSAREGNPIFWTSYARYTTKSNFHGFAREFSQRIEL